VKNLEIYTSFFIVVLTLLSYEIYF